MDPLTHSLFGAVVARTPAVARIPLAMPTLVVAANLPDVDVFAYFLSSSDMALAFRRGWTHGPVGLLVLPLLLSFAVVWWSRRRSTAPPSLRSVLALAYLGALSHPLLDWLNTYGVRFLMPFDERWFYGDALFIADPWVWLLLAGGLLMERRGGSRTRNLWLLPAFAITLLVWSVMPSDDRLLKIVWTLALAAVVALRPWVCDRTFASMAPTVALLAFVLYSGAMTASSRWARGIVAGELSLSAAEEEDILVSPLPGNPFAKEIVAPTGEGYRLGDFDWRRSPRLRLDPVARARPAGDERFDRAWADPCIRGFAAWARYPAAAYRKTGQGWDVDIVDLRYAREGTRGFGAVTVSVEEP